MKKRNNENRRHHPYFAGQPYNQPTGDLVRKLAKQLGVPFALEGQEMPDRKYCGKKSRKPPGKIL